MFIPAILHARVFYVMSLLSFSSASLLGVNKLPSFIP